jgi:hypothetical protein
VSFVIGTLLGALVAASRVARQQAEAVAR